MNFGRTQGTGLRGFAVAAAAALGMVVLGACGTAGPETGTDVEDIQNDPANDVFTDFSEVDPYVGQQVTVSAEVSEVLDPTAFTIADEAGEALLVLYNGSKNIEPETGIKVTGTVKKEFSVTTAEDFLGVEVDTPDVFGPFGGEPYIEATSIETNVAFDDGQ